MKGLGFFVFLFLIGIGAAWSGDDNYKAPHFIELSESCLGYTFEPTDSGWGDDPREFAFKVRKENLPGIFPVIENVDLHLRDGLRHLCLEADGVLVSHARGKVRPKLELDALAHGIAGGG